MPLQVQHEMKIAPGSLQKCSQIFKSSQDAEEFPKSPQRKPKTAPQDSQNSSNKPSWTLVHLPKASQSLQKAPKTPQIAPKCLPGLPNVPKMGPKGYPRSPKWTQNAFKIGHKFDPNPR